MNSRGWLHSELGDVAHALEYDHESAAIGRSHGIPNVEISALINLGLNCLALDQFDRARSYLEPTLERVVHEALGSHRWRWKIRLLLGLAEQLESLPLLYPLAHELGQWYETTGQERTAAEVYSKAKAAIDHIATSIEDTALRAIFLQSASVAAIEANLARLGR